MCFLYLNTYLPIACLGQEAAGQCLSPRLCLGAFAVVVMMAASLLVAMMAATLFVVEAAFVILRLPGAILGHEHYVFKECGVLLGGEYLFHLGHIVSAHPASRAATAISGTARLCHASRVDASLPGGAIYLALAVPEMAVAARDAG